MILRTLMDFNQLRNQAFSSATAISRTLKVSSDYDAHLLKILGETEIDSDRQKGLTPSGQSAKLGYGMKFTSEIKTTLGLVVVPDGQEVTRSLVECLPYFLLFKA